MYYDLLFSIQFILQIWKFKLNYDSHLQESTYLGFSVYSPVLEDL